MAAWALPAWPGSSQAGSSAPEAREAERAIRHQGTGTPGSERAIDHARSPRASSKSGRITLEETARDARQRPPPPKADDGYRSPTLDPAWRRRND
jgi:hypothetical protein